MIVLPEAIVDSHHHLWDLSLISYPWLGDEYTALKEVSVGNLRRAVPGSRSRSITRLTASAARIFSGMPELCPSP